MRSCASRGARSPGSARNSSSCSRSDRVRWRDDIGLSAAWVTGLLKFRGRVAAGRQDDGFTRIGRRRLRGRVDPFLQVFDAIDDTPAEFGIAGAGAVDAMLFECAD